MCRTRKGVVATVLALLVALQPAMAQGMLLGGERQTTRIAAQTYVPTGSSTVSSAVAWDPQAIKGEFEVWKLRRVLAEIALLKEFILPANFAGLTPEQLKTQGALGERFQPGVWDPTWPQSPTPGDFNRKNAKDPQEMLMALREAAYFGRMLVKLDEHSGPGVKLDYLIRYDPDHVGRPYEFKQFGGDRLEPKMADPIKAVKLQLTDGVKKFREILDALGKDAVPEDVFDGGVLVDATTVPILDKTTGQKRPIPVKAARDAVDKRTQRQIGEGDPAKNLHLEVQVAERTAEGNVQKVEYDGTGSDVEVRVGTRARDCPQAPPAEQTQGARPSRASVASRPALQVRLVSAESTDSRVQVAASVVASAACGEVESNSGGTPAPALDGLVTPELQDSLTEAEKLGGVDFSTLELRYLADGDDSGQGVRYAFAAGSSDGKGSSSPMEGLDAARLSSDAFFVWLSLPPSTFTVNLNPLEPDDIVDRQLGRTDVGRVLLEADLQMKRTKAELTHPDTPLGDRYWRQVQGSCVSGRTWIVPGPAKVRDTGDELFIIDAPLLVKTEAEFLQEGVASGDLTCPGQSRAASRHNSRADRRLIVPRLQRAVNTAPEYADLRRVFLARVAAEWYRERSETEATAFGHLIDSGDVDEWLTRTDWEPTDTFEEYVHSYRRGEYKVVDKVQQGGVQYRRTVTYGGVDFTDVPQDHATAAELAAAWPGFEDQVRTSLADPIAGGPVPGSILLGGESRYQPIQQHHVAPSPSTNTSTWIWLAAPTVGVLLVMVLLLRRRRVEVAR